MKMRCLVNGETVQDSSTNQMGRGGCGDADTVTVEIERIGALTNTVRVVAPRGGSR